MTNYANLDYTALNSKKISRRDFTSEQLTAAGLKNVLASVHSSVVSAAVTIITLAIISFLISQDFFKVLVFAALIVVGVVVVAYSDRRKLRTLKFALDNNMQYYMPKRMPPVDPIMFSIGNSRIQKETLTFPDESTMAVYEYTVGSGRNKTTQTFNFMCVKLPRNVPHIMLNSKGNFMNPDIGNYNVQKIALEGDFSKYFDLYIPPNYHVDVLQLFTPDVMATLLDFGKDFDFEFINDDLYIYQSGMLNLPWATKTMYGSEEKIKAFLMAVDKIAAQFDKQAKTYSDTRAGNVASGLVAHQGARLSRKRTITVGTIITIVAVLYLIFYYSGIFGKIFL